MGSWFTDLILWGCPARHELEGDWYVFFLSHAKSEREARVSCGSEIPWPGLAGQLQVRI